MLTDDAKENERLVNETLQNHAFIKYLEFTAPENPNPAPSCHSERSRGISSNAPMPWTLRKAIAAERQRISLPVVSVVRLYAMLQAVATEGEKQEPSTPTFFNYGGRYYIGIDRECTSLALNPITPELYTKKKTDAMLEEKYREN
jgi:hypothetical protein